MFKYYWRVLRLAFTHSLGAIDLWTGLGSGALGVLDHGLPQARLMTEFAWQIPLWALAAVMGLRLILAPYWAAKEDAAKIDAFEAASASEPFRVELATLRWRGVEIRNDVRDRVLSEAEWKAWENDVVTWNSAVVAAISKVNHADSLWFSILDVVPPPRLEMGHWAQEHEKHLYAMHDFRLARLDELIQKRWK